MYAYVHNTQILCKYTFYTRADSSQGSMMRHVTSCVVELMTQEKNAEIKKLDVCVGDDGTSSHPIR